MKRYIRANDTDLIDNYKRYVRNNDYEGFLRESVKHYNKSRRDGVRFDLNDTYFKFTGPDNDTEYGILLTSLTHFLSGHMSTLICLTHFIGVNA